MLITQPSISGSSNALIVLPIIDDIFRDPNVEPPTLLERLIVPTIVISRVGMLFKMMAFGVIVFVRDLSNSLSV